MRVKHVLNKEIKNVLFVFKRMKAKKKKKNKTEKGIIIIRRKKHIQTHHKFQRMEGGKNLFLERLNKYFSKH